jgi:nanoRNase/pAp phosphatase (c-di-AMP/oligoRNAs hydrolase)
MARAVPSEVFESFLKKHKHSKIAIATHTRADVDALASAFALGQVLPQSIVCTEEEMTEGAKALAKRLGISTKTLSCLNPKDFDGLAVVDTSAYTLLPQARGWELLLIIDHHRAEGRDMKGEFEIIEPESPSTAEIIAGIAPHVGKDAAFALCVGIIADAARFKSARVNTFETLARLMRIADAEYSELLALAEPDPKDEAKIAILSAMKRMEFVYAGGYLIATSEVGSNESDAASLISEAADVAFIAKWKDREKETRISARARKSVTVPLNEVMSEVGRELGGAGGGHAKAAGAALKAHTDEALRTCVEVFVRIAERSASKR